MVLFFSFSLEGCLSGDGVESVGGLELGSDCVWDMCLGKLLLLVGGVGLVGWG